MKNFLITLASALLLLACSDTDPMLGDKIKTVSYYQEHKEEREKLVSYCRDSAERQKYTNCVNAETANAQEEMNEFMAIPEALLDKPKAKTKDEKKI